MIIKDLLEKKINERQKKQKAKIVKKVTAGAVAGIVAGVAGGVLLAPKSGKETRDVITKTAKNLGENAINKTVEIKDTLDNKVVETKKNVVTAKEKISKYLSDKKAKKNENKDEAVIDENSTVEATDKTEE